MAVAALQKLPRAQARSFVPETIDLGDWAQIEPLLLKLEAVAKGLDSPEALEQWVLKASEVAAVLYQESSRRYIDMTCQTDDQDAEKAYLHFVENIQPKLKPAWQRLDMLFVSSPHLSKLAQERWKVFIRDTKKDIEIYRDENVPLQTELTKLGQQYQKLSGSLTVIFQDREQTLQQMGKYLEETDRHLRECAWQLVAYRRLAVKDEAESIYDKQIELRTKVAKNAGFQNYRDYAFKARGRFDYTPAMCEDFHAAVEQHIVPLARELQERRRGLLKLEKLRPWDLGVDPKGRPPLKPFENVETLIEKAHEVFRKVDPQLGEDFGVLRTHGLLELESRKGKAPGGYQATLEEARLPFIFMNAVGVQRDVATLLHEGGHAFHSLAAREEPLLHYRHAPIEFCEVASMSMELLALPHLEIYYGREGARRAQREQLEGVVAILPWIATIDAFQHWVYTNPAHSREERRTQWLALLERFGGKEDWSGLETARAYMWQRQLHLFVHAFYYVEYGIAQLGALQVWLRSQRDAAQAVAGYRKALSLGGSRPLPELFEAAGAQFEFSAKTVAPLADALRKELNELEDA